MKTPKIKRLYHGTSESAFAAIQHTGIVPRADDSDGNWAHSVVSHPDRVYLTDAYALYFALHAAGRVSDDERAAVLAIDARSLDQHALLPDEDFLARALWKTSEFEGKPLLDVTANVDARDYRHAWGKSLQYLGTCAHEGTVPAHSLARVAFIKPEAFPYIILGGHDPSITFDHYNLLGERYRGFCRWVFTGDAPPPTIPYAAQAAMLTIDPLFTPRTQEQDREFWFDLWTKNVEVVNLRTPVRVNA